jgi:hypothetical protein
MGMIIILPSWGSRRQRLEARRMAPNVTGLLSPMRREVHGPGDKSCLDGHVGRNSLRIELRPPSPEGGRASLAGGQGEALARLLQLASRPIVSASPGRAEIGIRHLHCVAASAFAGISRNMTPGRLPSRNSTL